jgi:hypothetical protein
MKLKSRKMSNSRRWRIFITWWHELVISTKSREVENLIEKIDDKIEEINKNET